MKTDKQKSDFDKYEKNELPKREEEYKQEIIKAINKVAEMGWEIHI